MENLFQSAVAEKISERMEKLQPETKPLWGKMNVSQMLAHCKVPLEVSLGQKQLKQTLLGILFGKMVKKQMLKPEPMKKNLPTVPDFVVKYSPDFYLEKQQLEVLIRKFVATNPDEIVARPHPFFGKMTKEQLGLFVYKHADHHLRQFGV